MAVLMLIQPRAGANHRLAYRDVSCRCARSPLGSASVSSRSDLPERRTAAAFVDEPGPGPPQRRDHGVGDATITCDNGLR
jgi:hypothetical protein